MKNGVAKVVNNHKVQLAATVVATAVATRKLTLAGAFTYGQMDAIMGNEELRTAFMNIHKEAPK